MLNFFKTPSKTDKTQPTDGQKQQAACESDPDGTLMLSSANRPLSAPISEGKPIAPASSIPMASAVISRAKLVDQRKKGGVGTFPLTNAVTIVSRKNEWAMSNADLLLVNDAGVSRNHATIERRHVDYWLRDLGSTNGTYLNNVLLKEEAKLKDGDFIRFHQVEFRFVMTDGEF